ncbi:MAG: GDP-mannose 4,6-dehydratase [Acidobacteria bacterium]|nr:GDP-mannose 4,6-dehydratase [Acidobacteriota bacterium]
MRALITGIAGFAGSHLADLLASLGYEVGGVDCPGVPLTNLTHLGERIKIYQVDITDGEGIRNTVAEISPDIIFHLAGISNVSSSWSSPIKTFEVNITGTFNLLKAASSLSPHPKVLLVSSAEVYGEVPEEKQPIDESFPLHPLSPYAVSKASLELLAYQFLKVEKLPVSIARPFNHTGPRQRENFVCSSFAKQIAEIEAGLKEPIIDVGNLETRRDYSDVRDIVRGYLSIVNRGKEGEAYNLASGEAYPISEILDILLSLSKERIEVRQDPSRYRPADIPLILGDADKANRELGWKAKIPLRETLADILSYWRERVKKKGED